MVAKLVTQYKSMITTLFITITIGRRAQRRVQLHCHMEVNTRLHTADEAEMQDDYGWKQQSSTIRTVVESEASYA